MQICQLQTGKLKSNTLSEETHKAKPWPLYIYHVNVLKIFIIAEKTSEWSLHIDPMLGMLKNFMAPFYGWGSIASRLEPLRGGSLLFTTKFPEIPGTHFIDLGRMKGWVDLGATQWFWARDPGFGNPAT